MELSPEEIKNVFLYINKLLQKGIITLAFKTNTGKYIEVFNYIDEGQEFKEGIKSYNDGKHQINVMSIKHAGERGIAHHEVIEIDLLKIVDIYYINAVIARFEDQEQEEVIQFMMGVPQTPEEAE